MIKQWLLWLLAAISVAQKTSPMAGAGEMKRVKSDHTNNWAVLVCTSAFWFNYRHVANVLSVYRMAKKLGIPDDHIILMLADDMACNKRNVKPGQIFGNIDHGLNVYGDDVEVDYRGCEVTVEMFIRLLTNRLPSHYPKSKRLLTDAGSNILVFMTGHGGDNFLKFQDSEEINAYDLAGAFEQMWQMKRYNEILFIIDTCQASTMFERIRSPNILAISSSRRGQSSYSYKVDDEIGVALIDRFTYSLLEFMQNLDMHSDSTIADFMHSLDTEFLNSNPEIRSDLFERRPEDVRMTDFFGNIRPVIMGGAPISISNADLSTSKGAFKVPQAKKKSDSNNSRKINYETFELASDKSRHSSLITAAIASSLGFGLLMVSFLA